MLRYYFSGLKNLLSIGKKFAIFAIVFLSVVTLFMHFLQKDKQALGLQPPTSASSAKFESDRRLMYEALEKKEYTSTSQGRFITTSFKTIACVAVGELCTANPDDFEKASSHSLLGMMMRASAYPLTHPPASGVGWLTDGLQQAGFIPKAYAVEGIGFSALRPFLNLWKVFRDISYMFLVLVLIVIGFMIMFRMKLNAQTVISVESALPRIVIALILITFSFAIAGFLIDLMYVTIALLISILSNNNAYYDAGKFQNEYLNADFWKIFGAMIPTDNGTPVIGGVSFLMTVGNQFMAFLGPLINGGVRTIAGLAALRYAVYPTFDVTKSFVESLDPFAGGTGGPFTAVLKGILFAFLLVAVPGIASALLPQLIIGILILMTIISVGLRIFFMLLRSYIQLLLLVVFAPLILLVGAIPGKDTFGFWIKSVIGELITFPIVIAIFIVGYIIVNTIAAPTNYIWAPPLIGGLDPSAFSMILGMGLIFIIPDIVKLFKEQLLGVKPLPIGLNPGTFFAGGITAASGGMGLIGGYGSLALAMPGIKNVIANKFNLSDPLSALIGANSKAERAKP